MKVGTVYATEQGPAVFLGLGREGFAFREVATAEQIEVPGPIAFPPVAPEDAATPEKPARKLIEAGPGKWRPANEASEVEDGGEEE